MRSIGFLLLFTAILLALATESHAAGETPQVNPEQLPPHIRHYLERQAGFREQNRTLQKVVLLGDSITEGFAVDTYFPGRPVVNRGISSDTIGIVPDEKDLRGVLKRLNTSVFDCCTTRVFLMIGINDLGDGHTPEAMLVGYRAILEAIRARAPGVTVHVESVLPTRARFAFHNANVNRFNAMLRVLAAEMGCPYMDLHDLLTDEKGELRADLTRDGLHINAAGYAIWKREIDKAMGWDE